jgi:hypothetical protein
VINCHFIFQRIQWTRVAILITECWLNMPLPVMSIFQGSEDLQLDTSLQHLEEDEAEEDQERRNKEVLRPAHSRH